MEKNFNNQFFNSLSNGAILLIIKKLMIILQTVRIKLQKY